jgi:hypothetical protein
MNSKQRANLQFISSDHLSPDISLNIPLNRTTQFKLRLRKIMHLLQIQRTPGYSQRIEPSEAPCQA